MPLRGKAIAELGVLEVHAAMRTVFRVDTNAGPVYMSGPVEAEATSAKTVIVEAERFLMLWQRHPHAEAPPDRESCFGDYKFKDAEAGFARGIASPVPLADVVVMDTTIFRSEPPWWKRLLVRGPSEPRWGVRFTNSITRTKYLLAHGASSFPVSCEVASARLLESLAGTHRERS